MVTAARKQQLPSEIPLGFFTITIPTDSRREADSYYDQFIDQVKKRFSSKNRRLSLFYTLEFEVESVTEGSKKYRTKAKLKRKKKSAGIHKALALAAALTGGVAAYPEIKDGATEIYQDVSTIFQQVADEENAKGSKLAPKVESCGPDDTPPTYRA